MSYEYNHMTVRDSPPFNFEAHRGRPAEARPPSRKKNHPFVESCQREDDARPGIDAVDGRITKAVRSHRDVRRRQVYAVPCAHP